MTGSLLGFIAVGVAGFVAGAASMFVYARCVYIEELETWSEYNEVLQELKSGRSK